MNNAESLCAAIENGDETLQGLELRLKPSTFVAMDDTHILIANRNTAQFKLWSVVTKPYIEVFIKWLNVRQAIEDQLELQKNQTTEEDGLSSNQEAGTSFIDVLAGLVDIDVLDERRDDLSGALLAPPREGWADAMQFINATRTTRETVFAVPQAFNAALAERAAIVRQPSAFYERVDCPTIALSDPTKVKMTRPKKFQEVLTSRRTARRYSDTPITEAQLSALLYYSWGMTDCVDNPLGDYFLRKTSPSGGSLHPIEVYPIVMNVEGIPSGVYHYSVRRHALEQIALDPPQEWIVAASGDQDWVAEAGVVFLVTAFLPRTAWKYNYSRVGRAVMAEIGYTGQSAFLTATWLGLGAFTTMALRDQIWEEKLGLDPQREPVLSITGAGWLEGDIKDHTRPRYEVQPGVASS